MQKRLYGAAVIICVIFGCSKGVAQQGVDPFGDDDYGLVNLFQLPVNEEDEVTDAKPDLTSFQSLIIDNTGHVYGRQSDGVFPLYLNSLPWAFFQSDLGEQYMDTLGRAYRICVCNP